jgi:hypothetical protein
MATEPLSQVGAGSDPGLTTVCVAAAMEQLSSRGEAPILMDSLAGMAKKTLVKVSFLDSPSRISNGRHFFGN